MKSKQAEYDRQRAVILAEIEKRQERQRRERR